MRALHVIVRGRVQGVWYRAWTGEQAAALGLRGWVRNRSDGAVEAVIAGSDEALETMLRRFHEGPPLAKVSAVESESWGAEVPEDFEQRPTA
ncbi:acylphosphatase [Limibacillus halophilus]